MCPDREILSVHADGEIGAPWDAAIAAHIRSCADCRATLDRIRETRRILREADAQDWIAPMERVRQRILSREATPRSPLWRRSIELPVPLAAIAAALLLFLGLAVALLALRVDFGLVRVSAAPGGAKEYQFTVPMDQFDELLKSVGADDPSGEEVIALPKNVKLVPAREPFIGKEAEFQRQKP